MFDNSTGTQQTQDNSGIMQASMPDPIDTPIQGPVSAVNSAFGSSPDMTNSDPLSPPSAPPVNDPNPFQTTSTPTIPATDPSVQATQTPFTDNPAPTATNNSSPSDDLLDLKQQALQHLSPLVNHLDQTPEEQFRTTMMMIQASDDQTLIKPAFEAAQKISDDKARAQALLDVINEINYFTQRGGQSNISS